LRSTEDATGRTTYTFDADGNQQRILAPNGDRTTYVWDYENRMTSVQLPSGIRNTMAYEPEGLRVKLEESTGVKKFVWDEQNYLAETDGSNDTQVVYTNEPRRYGNLVSQRRLTSGVWTPHWYHFDAIGSTRELTTSGQVVSDTRLYDAWGSTVGGTGSMLICLGYIGRVGYLLDMNTGTIHVRARKYVSAIGRWTSVDPLGIEFSLNLFTYALNTPVFVLDPSGNKVTTHESWIAYCKRLYPPREHPVQFALCLREFGDKTPQGQSKVFDVWYEADKAEGTDWMKDLPPCPCCIDTHPCCSDLPDSAVWTDPNKIKPFPVGLGIIGIDPQHNKIDGHPEAVWEIRTKVKNSSGAGNQCTYDGNGNLITGGYGAGSADKGFFGGIWTSGQHIGYDVNPFMAAYWADGGTYGEHVDRYKKLRPSINKKDPECPENIIPKPQNAGANASN
jgi:RHS repeat-associated protein